MTQRLLVIYFHMKYLLNQKMDLIKNSKDLKKKTLFFITAHSILLDTRHDCNKKQIISKNRLGINPHPLLFLDI